MTNTPQAQFGADVATSGVRARRPDLARVRIRSARLEDEAVVRTITIEAFDGVSIDQNIERLFGPVVPHPWQARKGAAVGQELRRAPADCFVAELDGRVIGYITTDVVEAAKTGRIPNIGVAREYRGLGLGTRLIEHALTYFRQRGLRLARIETLAQNPVGQHLYPKLGFRAVARQIHYAMPLDPLPATDTGCTLAESGSTREATR